MLWYFAEMKMQLHLDNPGPVAKGPNEPMFKIEPTFKMVHDTSATGFNSAADDGNENNHHQQQQQQQQQQAGNQNDPREILTEMSNLSAGRVRGAAAAAAAGQSNGAENVDPRSRNRAGLNRQGTKRPRPDGSSPSSVEEEPDRRRPRIRYTPTFNECHNDMERILYALNATTTSRHRPRPGQVLKGPCACGGHHNNAARGPDQPPGPPSRNIPADVSLPHMSRSRSASPQGGAAGGQVQQQPRSQSADSVRTYPPPQSAHSRREEIPFMSLSFGNAIQLYIYLLDGRVNEAELENMLALNNDDPEDEEERQAAHEDMENHLRDVFKPNESGPFMFRRRYRLPRPQITWQFLADCDGSSEDVYLQYLLNGVYPGMTVAEARTIRWIAVFKFKFNFAHATTSYLYALVTFRKFFIRSS